ncbi:uncharacterized protein LOC21391223 isoform X2 [Morus notabilis]|uniref:uncharacterized protein LOC21391223 isoform X2 n=1 Tax=Morus notabilis TaxID=981085 RepID=UPI000CECF362|nr:uncharacterized protein LOC21391223 isoform X2 [Morus notabilis]
MHGQQNSLTSNNCVLKGKSHTNVRLRKDAESKFNFSNLPTKEASMEEPSNKRLRDVSQILSILQKPRKEESMAAGYTDDKVTPTKRPKVSNAAVLELPEDDQPPKSLVPHDQSTENVDARESRENIDLDKPSDTMSSKEISSCSGSQVAKDMDNGNFDQLYSENTEVDAWCDGANASNMPSSAPSCGHVSDKKNLSQELTCVKEMDEYPSFDLGF